MSGEYRGDLISGLQELVELVELSEFGALPTEEEMRRALDILAAEPDLERDRR